MKRILFHEEMFVSSFASDVSCIVSKCISSTTISKDKYKEQSLATKQLLSGIIANTFSDYYVIARTLSLPCVNFDRLSELIYMTLGSVYIIPNMDTRRFFTLKEIKLIITTTNKSLSKCRQSNTPFGLLSISDPDIKRMLNRIPKQKDYKPLVKHFPERVRYAWDHWAPALKSTPKKES